MVRVFLFLLLSAVPAFAQSGSPIAAVGHIAKPDGRGVCTAALIGPDLILTAAHCVVNRKGDPIPPHRVVFRTGRYPGQPTETRVGAEVVRHPLYPTYEENSIGQLSFDVAIVRLDSAVSTPPLPLGAPAEEGERLLIASWRDAEEHRARERLCPAVEVDYDMVVLGCRIQGGESGAPIIRLTDDGAEVTAVMSSRAEHGVRKLGLAPMATKRVGQLRALLAPRTSGG